MTTPIRDQIVEALMDRLQALVKTEVMRMEPHTDQCSFISVWDLDEEAETLAFNVESATFPVTVEYVEELRSGDKAPWLLNVMLAQLKKEVCGGDSSFGGLAESVVYRGSDFGIAGEGQNLISVRAVFEINHHYPVGNPFTVAN